MAFAMENTRRRFRPNQNYNVISTGKELPPQASDNKLVSAKSLWGEGFALAFSSLAQAYFQA